VSTKSNIIKKKQPTYLTGLKALTNWIFGKQRHQKELEYIVNTYRIDNNIIKRFLLFSYSTPHIVYFINKYLNHLYYFNRFDTVDLINSLTCILDMNRISKKSIPDKILYLKNTELADKNKQKVKELFKEYFEKLFDKSYNEIELNFFYDLVNLNVITFEQISQMDKHLNSGKETFTLESVTLPVTSKANHLALDIYRELSPGIKQFCDQAKQYILNRPECKDCQLYGKPTVILDTNMEDDGEVDIIFFGLNPGVEEVEIGKPFVGKAGKILRERMSLLPPQTKWVITNVILCHTRNESEIKNPDDVKNRCRELVEAIRNTFPAKITVPLGSKAADWFGLKDKSISSISGKIFTSNNKTIIPIIHPSAANYNPENLNRFKNDFATILNVLKSQQSVVPATIAKTTPKTAPKEEQTVISGSKLITEVAPDLTFFDVREVNDKILLIYIDQQGQKKYKLVDYNVHFYLKNASWNECDQITDQVDAIVQVSGREKIAVTKLIRDKLNNLKNTV